MNAHKQLNTDRLLARRDIGVAPFVAEPRDFMPPQTAQSFDAMREPGRFVASRTRHDLSVDDTSMYGSVGADELAGMERAVRDHYDSYDGGASRHSFTGTVAAPSGDTLGTTQGAVGITRYGDAELSVPRPTVRYPREQSRTAEMREPSSRQFAYEPAQRVGDRFGLAVQSVPECYKSHVRLSPRAEAAVATLRAMHGSATRVVARHARTSTPAANKGLDGAYVASAAVSHHRTDDATIVSDRRDRSTTTRAEVGEAPSARQSDWHLEHRADREQVREAAAIGEMHSVRQAQRIHNDRETRVAVHEAPQLGEMHSVRQAQRIPNDRETRVAVHEAAQLGETHIARQPRSIGNDRENRFVVHGSAGVGALESGRIERPTLPTMSDRAGIAHRPSEMSVGHARVEPTFLAPRNERAGGPERRAELGHAPTKRLLGVHLEATHASARSVVQANLGAVEAPEDFVARDVDESTAVSAHSAPSYRSQHRAPTRVSFGETDRHDLSAPEYVNIAGRPRDGTCVRETLRLEPHHAASAVAPPVPNHVRARGRQEFDAW
jgi:hypothetical protein